LFVLVCRGIIGDDFGASKLSVGGVVIEILVHRLRLNRTNFLVNYFHCLFSLSTL